MAFHIQISKDEKILLKSVKINILDVEREAGVIMIDWKKMKDDIARGLKEGAGTVAKKTGELSAEGQRKLKVFNLKRRIQGYMENLGGAMYNAEVQTPGTISDDAAKEILKKIEVANSELMDLEKED